MKKTNLFILSLLLMVSFNIDLKADCRDEDLNEWATTIEPVFIENNGEHKYDYFYSYFLSISNIRDDIVIKVIDKNGDSSYGEKFELLNLYGVGCYTNLEEETYRIEVYGGENSKCKNELLRSLTYTVKPYNDMIKTEECEKYPNHELCQSFTDKTQNMTRDDFNKQMQQYEKSIKNSRPSWQTLFSTIREYGVYVLFPFFLISLIYIIKIHNYKKKESKE